MESKYDPKDLFLDEYNYVMGSENKEESTDKSLKIYHQCFYIYFNKDLIKRFEKTYEFYSKDIIEFIFLLRK